MKTLKINSYYSDKAESSKVHFWFNGVYLHGEVEQLCGYDICFPDNPEDFEGCVKDITVYPVNSEPVTDPHLFLEGVFPCIVDDKYECTAYLWYNKYDLQAYLEGEEKNLYSRTQRGLIVLNTDKESISYAQGAYNKRARHL